MNNLEEKQAQVLGSGDFYAILDIIRTEGLYGTENHKKLVDLTLEKGWTGDLIRIVFMNDRKMDCKPSSEAWEYLKKKNPYLYNRYKN